MSIEKERSIHLESLVQRALKKDALAQRQLYEHLSGKMLAVCSRYAGSREAAKDVMHDAFIVLFEKLGHYSGTGSFEGWARRIFVNTALTHLRKADVLRFSEPVEQVRVQPLSFSELDQISAQHILQCIASMPAGFRAVFNLFAIEGYPHHEIAAMLHISESTSRSQYLRARAWLQQKIKELE
ncbi:MAG: sigma-70 family RNA polymerase sigma factor [Bacteroidetes bacterium]|nr:sigma-70 family RNA polymerase sigma factor [Bacteroidota bacterium]